MCQLSIVNLNDKKLNEIADYFLSYGPSKFHSDGYGLIQSGRYKRTAIAPIRITNFGTWIEDIVMSSAPILSHIRQASHGVEVCENNAHPFESDNFLLMHNGTLVEAGKKRSYLQGQESDSKKFLNALEETYRTQKDFPTCFNETMKNWWGKFAFLIYHKKEKQYYVIRGYTASLYKIDLLEEEESKEVTGFIVNTDKDNLDMLRLVLRNMSQILYKEDLHFSEPTLLDINSIFVQDGNNLRKISDTKENEEKDFIKEEPKKGWWPYSNRTNNKEITIYDSDIGNGLYNKGVDDKSPLYKITTYQVRNWFLPKDMALIYKLYMGGKDPIQATEEELNHFADKVLPKLTPKGGISTLRFLRNELKGYSTIPVLLYTSYGLEYPWVLNPQKDIIQAVRKYNRDMEKAREARTN